MSSHNAVHGDVAPIHDPNAQPLVEDARLQDPDSSQSGINGPSRIVQPETSWSNRGSVGTSVVVDFQHRLAQGASDESETTIPDRDSRFGPSVLIDPRPTRTDVAPFVQRPPTMSMPIPTYTLSPRHSDECEGTSGGIPKSFMAHLLKLQQPFLELARAAERQYFF